VPAVDSDKSISRIFFMIKFGNVLPVGGAMAFPTFLLLKLSFEKVNVVLCVAIVA
jgi:hypothetical protein